MSKASAIFTRTRLGLDIRVWLTMIIAAILSLLLLGFKLATNARCGSTDILVRGYTSGKAAGYYLGETINFSVNKGKKQIISWDFGDHSPEKSGISVTHTYTHEGTFLVVATIDGRCTEIIPVHIKVFTDKTVPVAPPITNNPIEGTDVPVAGTPVNYSCSIMAGSYEWSVLNSPDFPVQTDNIATYTFTAPGTRILELRLDGDPSRVYRKTLQVLSAEKMADNAIPEKDQNNEAILPPPVVEEKKEESREKEGPKFLIIPDEEFRGMLDQVTDGKKDLQSFSQFLCNGDQTKVLSNGNEWGTLASLCAKLYDHKKYVIKSVTAVRDEKNCVTILKVNYKKKGLF